MTKIYFIVRAVSIACIILWQLTLEGNARAQTVDEFKWPQGEHLVYQVYWSVLRLGTIELRDMGPVTNDGEVLHLVELRIESNPYLFFVDMHHHYQCYLDGYFRPRKFMSTEISGTDTLKQEYVFFPEQKYYKVNRWGSGRQRDTLRIALRQTVYDGISLIYFTRNKLGNTGRTQVHAFFEDRSGPITFHWQPQPEAVELYGHNLPGLRVSGNIKMKGIAGLTGPYSGWFSADSRRIPLKARLKVFIGNVELILHEGFVDPN